MKETIRRIYGWNELTEHFGVGPQVIARWMTLRNFPKHEFVTVRRKWVKTWRYEDVLDWSQKNKDLFKRKGNSNVIETEIVHLPVGGRGPQVYEPSLPSSRRHGAVRF